MTALRKILCLFLVFSFVISDIPIYAETNPPVAAKSPEFFLPESLGKIEESVRGNNYGKTVLYIQDAHDSIEMQLNIAKIIREAVKKHGVKTVYEEGFEGPVPTEDYFGDLDSKIRKQTARKLLNEMRLGGAEYAHVMGSREFKLIGADKVQLLIRNVNHYESAAKRREAVSRDLQRVESEIQKLMIKHFPGPVREWLKIRERHESGSLDLLNYLKRSRELLFTKENREEKEKFYPTLTALLRLSEKPADTQAQASAIETRKLFEELDRMENDGARDLLKEKTSFQLFEYYKSLRLLERLIELKLAPEEYRALRQNLQAFKTRPLAEFVAKESRQTVVFSDFWESDIRPAMAFYETADARDQAVEDALKDFLNNSEESTAVLVYGGFHKQRIKEILHRLELSYKTIMPAMTAVNEKQQAYYRSLMSAGYYPQRLAALPANASRYPPVYVDGLILGSQKVRERIVTKPRQQRLNKKPELQKTLDFRVNRPELRIAEKPAEVQTIQLGTLGTGTKRNDSEFSAGNKPPATFLTTLATGLYALLTPVQTFKNIVAIVRALFRTWFYPRQVAVSKFKTLLNGGTNPSEQQPSDWKTEIKLEDLPSSKARSVLMKLREAGIEATVYGGAIRELVTGQFTFTGDVDILLNINVKGVSEDNDRVKIEWAAFRAAAQKLHVFVGDLMDGQCRINGVSVDVLGFIDQDQKVRYRDELAGLAEAADFSINRLGLSTQGHVIDSTGTGLNDSLAYLLKLRGKKIDRYTNYQTVFRALKLEFQLSPAGFQFDDATHTKIGRFFTAGRHAARYEHWIAAREQGLEKVAAAFKELARLRQDHQLDTKIDEARERIVRSFITWLQARKDFKGRDRFLDVVTTHIELNKILKLPYETMDAAGQKEIDARMMNAMNFEDGLPYGSPLDFSGAKERSIKDAGGVGILVGDIYRVAPTPQAASEALRRVGAERFLNALGIDLESAESEKIAFDERKRKAAAAVKVVVTPESILQNDRRRAGLTAILDRGISPDGQKEIGEIMARGEMSEPQRRFSLAQLQQAAQKVRDYPRDLVGNPAIPLDDPRLPIAMWIQAYLGELIATDPELGEDYRRDPTVTSAFAGALIAEAASRLEKGAIQSIRRDGENATVTFEGAFQALHMKLVKDNESGASSFYVAPDVLDPSSQYVLKSPKRITPRSVQVSKHEVFVARILESRGSENVHFVSHYEFSDGRYAFLMKGPAVKNIKKYHDDLSTADRSKALVFYARRILSAFEQGVALQDLKPENILPVFEDGQLTDVLPIDYAAAKIISPEDQYPNYEDPPIWTHGYRISDQAAEEMSQAEREGTLTRKNRLGIESIVELISTFEGFGMENYLGLKLDIFAEDYEKFIAEFREDSRSRVRAIITEIRGFKNQFNGADRKNYILNLEPDFAAKQMKQLIGLFEELASMPLANPGSEIRQELRSELRQTTKPENYDAIVSHPVWLQMTSGTTHWFGAPDAAERILWNHPDLFEEAAKSIFHNSFMDFLNAQSRHNDSSLFYDALWRRLPKDIIDRELDAQALLDAEGIRTSRFFRYPAQYEQFYKKILNQIRDQKRTGLKTPIKIDAIGAAYFQEPLTLLALVKTAYEVNGANPDEIPLEINVYDNNPFVFDLFSRRGLVYRKDRILERLETAAAEAGTGGVAASYARMGLMVPVPADTAARGTGEGSEMLRDLKKAGDNLLGLLTPVNENVLALDPQTPWVSMLKIRGDYGQSEASGDVSYVFVNNVLRYNRMGEHRIMVPVTRRLAPSGVFFSVPEDVGSYGFEPHPDLLRPEDTQRNWAQEVGSYRYAPRQEFRTSHAGEFQEAVDIADEEVRKILEEKKKVIGEREELPPLYSAVYGSVANAVVRKRLGEAEPNDIDIAILHHVVTPVWGIGEIRDIAQEVSRRILARVRGEMPGAEHLVHLWTGPDIPDGGLSFYSSKVILTKELARGRLLKAATQPGDDFEDSHLRSITELAGQGLIPGYIDREELPQAAKSAYKRWLKARALEETYRRSRKILLDYAALAGIETGKITAMQGLAPEQIFDSLESELMARDIETKGIAVFPHMEEIVDFILARKLPIYIMTGAPRRMLDQRGLTLPIARRIRQSGGEIWGSDDGTDANYPADKLSGMQRITPLYGAGKILSIGDGLGEARAAQTTGNPFVLVDRITPRGQPSNPGTPFATKTVLNYDDWQSWLPQLLDQSGIKAVVFDWDGTIADADPYSEIAQQRLLYALHLGLQGQPLNLPEDETLKALPFSRDLLPIFDETQGISSAKKFRDHFVPYLAERAELRVSNAIKFEDIASWSRNPETHARIFEALRAASWEKGDWGGEMATYTSYDYPDFLIKMVVPPNNFQSNNKTLEQNKQLATIISAGYSHAGDPALKDLIAETVVIPLMPGDKALLPADLQAAYQDHAPFIVIQRKLKRFYSGFMGPTLSGFEYMKLFLFAKKMLQAGYLFSDSLTPKQFGYKSGPDSELQLFDLGRLRKTTKDDGRSLIKNWLSSISTAADPGDEWPLNLFDVLDENIARVVEPFLDQLEREGIIGRPEIRQSVKPENYDEIVSHPNWKKLKAMDHLDSHFTLERLLWNYPEAFNETARYIRAGNSFFEMINHPQFKEYVHGFTRIFWAKLPRDVREENEEEVLDSEISRKSMFVRFPKQFQWFYSNLFDRITAQRKLRDKTPLKIDLVGPAYFQEPLSVLAAVKTAYEKTGITLEDIPLEIHLYDKDNFAFDMFRRGGMIFSIPEITNELQEARIGLPIEEDESILVRDWGSFRQNLNGLLTPVTDRADAKIARAVPGDVSGNPWMRTFHLHVDYTKAEKLQASDYVFLNNLLFYIPMPEWSSILNPAHARLKTDGFLFSLPSAAPPDKNLFSAVTAKTSEKNEAGVYAPRAEIRSKDRLNNAQAKEMVDFAHELMAAARAEIDKALKKAAKGGLAALGTQKKLDRSLVTEVDTGIQRLILKRIRAQYPDHYLLGEEELKGRDAAANARNENSDFVWILDPIDGTKMFSQGKDGYGISLALYYKGQPVLGMIDSPVWGGILEATQGVEGAYINKNGKRKRLHLTNKPPHETSDILRGTTPIARALSRYISLNPRDLRPHEYASVVSGAMLLTDPEVGFHADMRGTSWPAIWDIAAIHMILQAAGAKVMVAEPEAAEMRDFKDVMRERILNLSRRRENFQWIAGIPELVEEVRPALDHYLLETKLVREGQDLLDLLARSKVPGAAVGFRADDAGKLNPAILALGSPSPQTFVNLAKVWKEWNALFSGVKPGFKIPIIASTGRARGTARLIQNTQKYYDMRDLKVGSRFRLLIEKEGEKLTEARIIQFILETEGVPRGVVSLENVSTNTKDSMLMSLPVIQKRVKRSSPDASKPVKLMVVTDAFHRLRALHTAMENLKDQPWQFTAEAVYIPDLKNMHPKDRAKYWEYMIGYPEGMGNDTHMRGSEIERINTYFPGKLDKSAWTVERIKKIRGLFERYLRFPVRMSNTERAAFLKEAQEYLQFLALTRVPGASPNMNPADFKNVNPAILTLGSPSAYTFINLAARYKQWNRAYQELHPGQNIPIVASTGRGRGVQRLVDNVQAYYDQFDSQKAAKFEAFRKKLGDKITEAKTIRFVLVSEGVPGKAIRLEEISNNTLLNITESQKVIRDEVLPQVPDKKKPLKVTVVTDGFHLLRSQLYAVREYVPLGWQVTTEPVYIPALDRMPEKELRDYLEFLIGYPEEFEGMHFSELQRIMRDFEAFDAQPWSWGKIEGMRDQFGRYLSSERHELRAISGPQALAFGIRLLQQVEFTSKSKKMQEVYTELLKQITDAVLENLEANRAAKRPAVFDKDLFMEYVALAETAAKADDDREGIPFLAELIRFLPFVEELSIEEAERIIALVANLYGAIYDSDPDQEDGMEIEVAQEFVRDVFLKAAKIDATKFNAKTAQAIDNFFAEADLGIHIFAQYGDVETLAGIFAGPRRTFVKRLTNYMEQLYGIYDREEVADTDVDDSSGSDASWLGRPRQELRAKDSGPDLGEMIKTGAAMLGALIESPSNSAAYTLFKEHLRTIAKQPGEVEDGTTAEQRFFTRYLDVVEYLFQNEAILPNKLMPVNENIIKSSTDISEKDAARYYRVAFRIHPSLQYTTDFARDEYEKFYDSVLFFFLKAARWDEEGEIPARLVPTINEIMDFFYWTVDGSHLFIQYGAQAELEEVLEAPAAMIPARLENYKARLIDRYQQSRQSGEAAGESGAEEFLAEALSEIRSESPQSNVAGIIKAGSSLIQMVEMTSLDGDIKTLGVFMDHLGQMMKEFVGMLKIEEEWKNSLDEKFFAHFVDVFEFLHENNFLQIDEIMLLAPDIVRLVKTIKEEDAVRFYRVASKIYVELEIFARPAYMKSDYAFFNAVWGIFLKASGMKTEEKELEDGEYEFPGNFATVKKELLNFIYWNHSERHLFAEFGAPAELQEVLDAPVENIPVRLQQYRERLIDRYEQGRGAGEEAADESAPETFLAAPVAEPRNEIRRLAEGPRVKGTLMLDAADLAGFSPEEQEVLYKMMAMNRSELRMVIYGENSSKPLPEDVRTASLLKLSNVRRSGADAEEALKQHGFSQGIVTHLSRSESKDRKDPRRFFSGRYQPRLKFFLLRRQPAEIGAAAIYTLNNGQLQGITEEGGFVSSSESFSQTLSAEYLAHLVVAWAA